MSQTDQAVPIFFASKRQLRDWFERNHDRLDEQWIGFYKKATGVASIDWQESVDEALCFGWIDGVRRSIDGERYMIRFTPRRRQSHWSKRNLQRIRELIEEGVVHPAGLAIYDQRDPKKQKQASYEQDDIELPAAYQVKLRANDEAWSYWSRARPSYRKQVSWWIVSAKRETTRRRRLDVLIECSCAGERIPPLRWSGPERQ